MIGRQIFLADDCTKTCVFQNIRHTQMFAPNLFGRFKTQTFNHIWGVILPSEKNACSGKPIAISMSGGVWSWNSKKTNATEIMVVWISKVFVMGFLEHPSFFLSQNLDQNVIDSKWFFEKILKSFFWGNCLHLTIWRVGSKNKFVNCYWVLYKYPSGTPRRWVPHLFWGIWTLTSAASWNLERSQCLTGFPSFWRWDHQQEKNSYEIIGSHELCDDVLSIA